MMRMRGAVLAIDGTYLRPSASPTITVRLLDGNLASIYATNSLGDAKANPFAGGTDGEWDFYIGNTRCNVIPSGGTPVVVDSISDLLAFDPSVHFAFTNFNSGYVYVQNSSGIATPTNISSLLGAVDHGALAGLADDDHAQYALISGSRFFSGPVGLPAGSVTAPSLVGTSSALRSGVWFPAANQVAFSASGGLGDLRLLGNALTLNIPFLVASGLVTAPIIAGSGDPDTGVWWRAANVLSLVASGGAGFMDIAGTYIAQNVPSYLPAGTAAAPSLANSNGARDGIYFSPPAVALSSSGGLMTAVLDARSGFNLNGRFNGDGGGLATSSYLISADATLALADQGKCLIGSHATVAIGLRIPANATVAFPLGASFLFARTAAASCTIINSSNVTVLAPAQSVASKSLMQGLKLGTDTWMLGGNLF